MQWRHLIPGLACAAACFLSAGAVAAAPPAPAPAARDVVVRALATLWGRTLQAEVDMTITAPGWSRTLTLQTWMFRPHKSLLRVKAPAKDAGITSLRIGTEMWNYIPAIERTIKIPPSLMLQPWLGSDFTNDDLVKESSLIDDYTHELLPVPPTAGADAAYVVQALPRPEVPVVWGKVVLTTRADFIPLKQEFYDERGRLVRTLTYDDIRRLGGRELPTHWVMTPQDKPGKSTTIVFRSATYDQAMDDALFTLQQLKH